ncbi:MAG: ABC transporter ATP-binding protein [Leptospiraceae bacterium]|nr:MAG: ABC transporter ATP-binding protein [Leptospiraceae bacterium]
MKPLIDIKNLSYHIGSRTIFDNISFTINQGDTIGVIGKNGVGKTTFYRLIKKEIEPDSGEIIYNKNAKFGFLDQLEDWEEEEIVIDYIIKSSKQDPWICYKYCFKLGLTSELLTVPLHELSSGYKMRVKLAAVLSTEPDFLFLDEPTNYLDLDTQLFLERILEDLKNQKKGYFIISHDREFLLRTCENTLEITQNYFQYFKGNVNLYLEWKQKQIDSVIETQKEIQKKKEKLESFINRFKAKATKSSQAKSKEKQLQRIQEVPLKEHFLLQEKKAFFQFINVPIQRGIIFECNMSTGYGNKIISNNVELYLSGSEKYAIIGPNGEGKTTFLKTIAGIIPPIEGYYRWQKNKRLGYYSNEMVNQLDNNLKVIDILLNFSNKNTSLNEIKKIAGIMLFQEQDFEKKVTYLSGGERVRLFLAGLLLQKNDILILDEPNTHLDFETTENLALALKEFDGTVFFVSHDRTFVKTIATKIIEVFNKKIQVYPGNYEDYVYHKRLEVEKEHLSSNTDIVAYHILQLSNKQNQGKTKKNGTSPLPSTNPDDPLSNKKALLLYFDKNYKARKKEIRKLREELREMEKVLKELEQKRDELWNYIEENGLHTPENYEKMQKINERLEELENKWYELQSRLDELENL